ncbi:MAG: efflux transporter periplasmic adaptor subunit [Parachlamydia sp.]|nr:MAG: efflux transporter periplasmic adaptor subunit [Parachlamydia sp.]
MSIFKTFSFYFAVFGILLAALFSKISVAPSPSVTFVHEPAEKPFINAIAASGIVEAKDKNIEIGTPEEGILVELWHHVGDKVEQGDPLFRIDSATLEAQVLVETSKLKEAKIELENLENQLQRYTSIRDPRAISQDEFQRKKYELSAAQARVEAAEASLAQTLQQISRLKVLAPKSGIILQQNIRVGENVSRSKPAIILGDLDHLQIRVDVDEQSAGLFNYKNPAIAFPKNKYDLAIPLTFVRVEPFVIPKKSLSGAGDERVDTRVLQIIYAFDAPENYPIYVGQQADVYIEKNH